MNKLSIKRRLLIYSLLIQFAVIIIFSFSLYRALYSSSIDKVESTLKIIILDIADSFSEKKQKLDIYKALDKEKEYQFRPLYIRLVKFDKKLEILKTTDFPSSIRTDFNKYKILENSSVSFEDKKPYIIGRLKISIDDNPYVVEIATNYALINSQLDIFLDKLLFLIPIILILSTLGGYFLIYKSFAPVEKILMDLKDINATELSKRLELSNNHNDEIDSLAKEINNLLERLELSFEQISQFSSDASHELKTPLTIIRGEIEVGLRKCRTAQEYKEILSDTLNEVLSIKNTIDNLLFLAKSEHNTKRADMDEVYLDEMTLESIKELNSFALSKDINIKCEIKDAIQIKGHSSLLKIAIKNIIKNAINFSYPKNDVIIENYIKDGEAIISIKDFGIGIAKDEQKKVFDKFYRTDKSRSKNTGGTGLGMSIVQKIIKIHKGSIEIISEENKGTTVLLRFTQFT